LDPVSWLAATSIWSTQVRAPRSASRRPPEKTLWSERLEGASWGSLVLSGDRLYVTSRRGVTTVFRAHPGKLEVLATNDLGESSHASPAISDGQIFLCTDRHLYCIGEN
jgi:outer membrane protein assembly factor BamB